MTVSEVEVDMAWRKEDRSGSRSRNGSVNSSDSSELGRTAPGLPLNTGDIFLHVDTQWGGS